MIFISYVATLVLTGLQFIVGFLLMGRSHGSR
jgi:hypothetical protein